MILKPAPFVVLVVVLSSAGIDLRNKYGSTVGLGFTIVFVPVVLKLLIAKFRTIYGKLTNV
ncbi:MAG: hypothetical protein ABI477_22205 [Chryseolinea sp.]